MAVEKEAEKEIEKPAKKTLSRRSSIIMILTIIAVLIVVLAFVFIAPISRVRLVLENRDSSYQVHVGIYIDGKLKEIIYLDHGDQYTNAYQLSSGSHSVGFDFSYSSYDDIDGVVDELHTFQLALLRTLTLSYSFDY